MGRRSAGAFGFCALLAAAGCVEFTAPDIPDAGGPAIVALLVAVSDSGTVAVSGSVRPGRDVSGVLRAIPSDAVTVLGRTVEPVRIRDEDERTYSTNFSAAADVARGPVDVVAPAVEGVGTAPPSISFSGLVRLDPDTITLRRGDDLVLRTAPGPGASTPPPGLTQWFLQLGAADDAFFGLSGGGTVPETLVVPARYVPEVPGGLIGVRLIQIRTISFPPERGNYFGTVSVQIRLHWTVRVTESEPSKGAG
jgi:hypothetical protein